MRKSRFSLVCAALGVSASAGLVHVACTSTVDGTGTSRSLGGAAGESSSGGANGGGQAGNASGGGIDGPDETAPTVASISPEDGAKGVLDDAKVVIVFSEPMDQASVEDAYESGELPKGAVSFEWNEAGDTLTITPNEPLEYAVGSDPFTVVAKKYTLSLHETAKDLAGNSLAMAKETNFWTKRALYTELQIDPTLTGGYGSDDSSGTSFVVGDDAANVEHKFFVSFYMSALAEGAEITSATFGLDQTAVSGNPYPSAGTVVAVPLYFNSLGGAYMNATGYLSPIPVSTTSTLERKYLDAAPALAASVESQAEHFQLRFEFSFAPTLDSQTDSAEFDLSQLKLAVNYTVD